MIKSISDFFCECVGSMDVGSIALSPKGLTAEIQFCRHISCFYGRGLKLVVTLKLVATFTRMSEADNDDDANAASH